MLISKEEIYQQATMKSISDNANGTRMDVIYLAMDMYAAERAKELEEALKAVLRIKNLWQYSGDVLPEHEGEAQALSEMEAKVKNALDNYRHNLK